MDESEGKVMDGVRAYKSEYLSDRVARVVDDELPELVARLDAAGYDGDYEILGAGQTAVIFFDPLTSRVLKVARSEESRFMLLDEYEFLTAMQGTSAAKLVPQVYDFDPVAGVLVREGIEGRPGGWGTRGLRDLYEEIVRVARLQDWSAPEYKEDSFIIRDDGSIVMVDVGFTGRFGQRLAAHIREALLSPMSIHRAQQFAYELRWEVGDKRLTREEANALIVALSEKVGQRFDLAD